MKCTNSECKSYGFFAYPQIPSERFCMTHKTPDMVNIRSFGKKIVRSTVFIEDATAMGLRTQAGPSIPPSRVPKVKTVKSPVRTIRTMKVPGAPVKVKGMHIVRIRCIPKMPLLNTLVNVATQVSKPVGYDNINTNSGTGTVGFIQPDMEIYKEIAQRGAPDWKVVARRIPLIAYCN